MQSRNLVPVGSSRESNKKPRRGGSLRVPAGDPCEGPGHAGEARLAVGGAGALDWLHRALALTGTVKVEKSTQVLCKVAGFLIGSLQFLAFKFSCANVSEIVVGLFVI